MAFIWSGAHRRSNDGRWPRALLLCALSRCARAGRAKLVTVGPIHKRTGAIIRYRKRSVHVALIFRTNSCWGNHVELRRGKIATPSGLGSWCALLLLLLLTACGTGGGNRAIITEFTASPTTVVAGGEVILRWNVQTSGAVEVRLESLRQGAVEPSALGDVSGQSSTVVKVDETTTFRLVAIGSGVSTQKEITVSVEPDAHQEPEEPDLPLIEEFKANPLVSKPGEPVTLTWNTSHASVVSIDPLGTEVGASGSIDVNPESTTTYTITASSEHGTATKSLTVEVDASDRLLFLVAGQSNASGTGLEEGGEFPVDGKTEEPAEGVRMLTRDLEWVEAREPTHEGEEHSFLLRFGKEVQQVTGADVYLVPAAVGGSALHSWDPDDSSENFERAMKLANFASESLGIPFAAIIWYQGESDTKTEERRNNYVENTDEVLQAFRDRLPGSPGVIFVQLSKRLWTEELDEPGNVVKDHNLAYQVVRERQRLMEAGANTMVIDEPGESGIDRPSYYMAVTHDLPMSDAKHISAAGQRRLGVRIATIYLQCIERTCQEPPGPRLEMITRKETTAGSSILIHLSEAVQVPPNLDDYFTYFTVFDKGQAREDFNFGFDSGNTVIRLDFDSALGSQVEVRYMPPQELDLFVESEHVIKDLSGLPLPAFGMPVEPPPDGSISGLRLPDE